MKQKHTDILIIALIGDSFYILLSVFGIIASAIANSNLLKVFVWVFASSILLLVIITAFLRSSVILRYILSNIRNKNKL